MWQWKVDGYAQPCAARIAHALITPPIADNSESPLTPLGRIDALGPLLQQSALSLTLNRVVAAQQVDILKLLAHQADAYRLNAGQDALDIPTFLERLLSEVLKEISSQER